MKLGVLCSGGKDSLYACGCAMREEEVACLISIRSANPESYMFHTPNVHLVPLQAEAAGLPLVEVETAGEKENELEDLERALECAVERYGIEGVVTGAILSVYQATRVQKICNSLDLWCFNPLWHTDQEKYMESLFTEGFRVIIAGVFAAPFDETWLGREITREVIDELRAISGKWRVSLTGEGGEFETLVLDAPFFRKRIRIYEAAPEYANHNGVIRVTRAELEDK
ncbi:diphthine--ammonia ligase [Methanolinea mesophila]|uniref:diphthine--ammonia ligase n=1 Tax=Methanolinea mesophila TaxID=547055 RepID=UPI001AE7EC13|nr:diphthine--ammonia ligase [Methanolinea mesophila]